MLKPSSPVTQNLIKARDALWENPTRTRKF
jgi:hypothetical protein